MIYLASPYSHPDPAVRRARYEGAQAAVAYLLKRREWVYSPIVYAHHVAKKHKLPTDNGYWKDFNLEFLKLCDKFYILELYGWLDSVGIQWESGKALDRGLVIYHMAILHNGHYEIHQRRDS